MAEAESGKPDLAKLDRGQLEPCEFGPAQVSALYREHAEELRRFLVGLLRDWHLAADVMQTTFAKAVEQGHTAKEESLKSWLFTIAYREAMNVRRREGAGERALVRKAFWQQSLSPDQPSADSRLVHWETVERVRQALQTLPAEQAEVVRRRMFEGQKFAAIASDLRLPLGTVLTRMRTALATLRKTLREE